MITTTLDAMAAGGIHDQLGGGFARYSTDETWLVPHFEKMLYDNALLTRAYLHGYLVTGEPRYRRVVEDIVGYVLRDLADPTAASTPPRTPTPRASKASSTLVARRDPRGVRRRRRRGDPLLRRHRAAGTSSIRTRASAATSSTSPTATSPSRTRSARSRPALLERRGTRVRPGPRRQGAARLERAVPRRAHRGRRRARPRRLDGRGRATNARFLLARAPPRRRPPPAARGARPYLAYAEDYAALLEALLTLAELDDVAWLADARAVADELLRLFLDPDGGGFFTTGHDAEPLVVRPKDVFDDATPSANSLAANGLLRLRALTGDERYAAPAVAILEMLAGPMTLAPDRLRVPARRARAPRARADRDRDRRRPDRRRARAALRAEVTRPARSRVGDARRRRAPTRTIPLLADRPARDAPTAYVCEHYACREPVTTPDALRAQLDAVAAA